MSKLIRHETAFPAPPSNWVKNSSPKEAEATIDLRYYYEIPAKRKWLILAVILTVTGLVGLQTFTTTPLYKSTARIQIDPENVNILPYEELYTTPLDFHAGESYLKTQYEVLQSDTLARRTIRRLELTADPVFASDRQYGFLIDLVLSGTKFAAGMVGSDTDSEFFQAEDWQIEQFKKNLEVAPVTGTRLVEVSYVSVDPGFSGRVVNTLGEEFVRYNFETRYESTSRATDFLQERLRELKIKVEKSEEDLIEYAREKGILNVNERENVVLQMLTRLNEEMATVRAELIAETAHYVAVQNAPEGAFPQVLENPVISDLEERRSQVKQQLASLSTQFLPGWPEVVKLQEQLEEIERELAREREDALQQAQLHYAIVEDQYSRLSTAFEEQKTIADQLAEDSIQYNILKREVETNKQLYEGLLQRLKEAGVAAGLNSSNIHIVDEARPPVDPYWPRPKLHLALGLIMGSVLAVSLAFLTEYMDNTLKTPDEIEEFLTLPSLGVIPTLDELSLGRQRRSLKGQGGQPQPALLPYSEPRSRVWEAYRSLRTSLLLSQSNHPPQKMLITSAFAGEGKTTTVANTGIVLAQTGASTILIDLDMRRSTLASLFGLNPEEGVSSYLSGNSDLTSLIHQTGVPNLCILPAGPQPPNAAELIGSDRMDRLFRLLEDEFKYIVVDSPPVLSVTDAQILAQLVDGVVLVIYGGRTPRDAARKAVNQLCSVGGKVLGGMVNKIDVHRSEYAYYYRYYYDDHYYRQVTS
jgi:capsular exopolysaccharide synthesis family protein